MTDVRTGDIVLYCPIQTVDPQRSQQLVWLPALVVVTHEDWSAGRFGPDGKWIPTSPEVPQPDAGHVDLIEFLPSKTDPTLLVMNVPEGTGSGSFKRRAA